MNWHDFSQHLSEQLSESIEIITAHSVAGGDIHQAYQLHTNQGNLFIKMNQAGLLPLFETESHNLQAINQSNTVRCPKVKGVGVYQNNQAWLLMENLQLTHTGDDYQRGRDIAFMHQQIHSASQPFGWFEDNYIGHSIQKNQWHFNWVDFYGNQRLKPQLDLAQLRGADNALFDLGHQLIEALPFWFTDYTPKASLLHGDLWGGNSAFTLDNNQQTEAVIYDPASYYGDRETDIAMTELFGGFSPDFYTGYHSVFPLDSGYSKRRPLYNLYHVINHFNLFGGGYEQQALQIIQKLLKQSKTTTIYN